MTFLQKKLWLAWSKFRFLRLPRERRVRLEVEQDGRHLTFLLVSLYEAGYGVYVVDSPWIFRELNFLRKTAPIPFVYGGTERKCGQAISDRQHFPLVTRHSPYVLLDYDYFSGLTTGGVSHGGTANTGEEALQGLASQVGTSKASGPASTPATSHSLPATAPKALRMPYFMHPSVYHRGLHKSQSAERSKHVPCSATVQALDLGHPPLATSYPPQGRRRFRIGFFGTHDREFYTRHYHFPGMNRFEILEIFLKKFGVRMKALRGFPRDWDACEIAVSIDGRGGDRQGKNFLSQEHYFEALRECDFVLSPPGWCMPVSHNLIEAMFCGAIPITNAGAFTVPPLQNEINCLDFSGAADFVVALEKAFTMSDQEIEKKKGKVLEYYFRYLNTVSFGEQFRKASFNRLLVNAEEKSVPLAFACGSLVN